MADVDALLDEIECSRNAIAGRPAVPSTTYTTPPAPQAAPVAPAASSGQGGSSGVVKNTDIDALLNDLDLDDGGSMAPPPAPARPTSASEASRAATSRPAPTASPKAALPPPGQRKICSFPKLADASSCDTQSCSNLICYKCDLNVCHFPNYRWDDDVPYIFLRHFVPDFEKLKPKLHREDGSVAYACQCKNITVKEGPPLAIDATPQLTWRCLGH